MYLKFGEILIWIVRIKIVHNDNPRKSLLHSGLRMLLPPPVTTTAPFMCAGGLGQKGRRLGLSLEMIVVCCMEVSCCLSAYGGWVSITRRAIAVGGCLFRH